MVHRRQVRHLHPLGMYSVPAYAPVLPGKLAYSEWYWNSLTEGKKATPKPMARRHVGFSSKASMAPTFPYSEFRAACFSAELFDPDHWADVFERSGAKYVALTSKHHEGFTLVAERSRPISTWGRPWNAVDIGPQARPAARPDRRRAAQGPAHGHLLFALRVVQPALALRQASATSREHMIPQFKDVVTHCKPGIIFSDGEWEMPSAEWRSPELLAWLFNESPVQGRSRDRRPLGQGHPPQARRLLHHRIHRRHAAASTIPGKRAAAWASPTATTAWRRSSDYHTGRELLMMLIDIVSRGGNLLLDIGPTADGRIPVDHGGAADCRSATG